MVPDSETCSIHTPRNIDKNNILETVKNINGSHEDYF
jgi:hypothetical protein